MQLDPKLKKNVSIHPVDLFTGPGQLLKLMSNPWLHESGLCLSVISDWRENFSWSTKSL